MDRIILRERKLGQYSETSHLGRGLVGRDIGVKIKRLHFKDTSRKQPRRSEIRESKE